MSHELRIASPADKPVRVIAGAFYQRQSNFIHQDYRVDGLAPIVVGERFPGHIAAFTQQKRVDRDYARPGGQLGRPAEGHVDRRRRLFRYNNDLIGFFGFGRHRPTFRARPQQSASKCGRKLTDRRCRLFHRKRISLPMRRSKA